MFCENCGTENDNSAAFCKNCGKPLASGEANTQAASQPTPAPTPVQQAQSVNAQPAEKKPIPYKLIAIAAGAVVALIVILALVFNARRTINLNKYMTVEATGYDGFGHVTATIDWDAIEDKYGDRMEFTKKAKREYGGWVNLVTPVEALEESVDVEIDKKDKLSNGDEIKYTIELDEDVEEYFNCKIKYKEGTFKVKDLEKVDTFDAFANLEVSFDGVGPNGTVNLNYKGSELSISDFNVEPSTGLSNGDKVVISIDESNIETMAQSIGKIPADASKKYKVKGLKSYLQKASDLSKETLESMKKQGDDTYRAYVASDWDEGATLDSFEYIGTYLLTAKSDDIWGSHNKLYVVFKATADTNYETYHQKNYAYWYLEYDDVLVDEKGNSDIDITNYRTGYNSFKVDTGISSGWWSTKYWYFDGYATLNDLYKEVVTSQAEKYNHDDNVTDTESATVTEEESSDEESEETEE